MIWLGGTFGVGKTTTAAVLVHDDPGLQLFDPEWVGYLLRHHLPGEGVTDFQQFSSWRRLVPIVADEVARATGKELVVVQSVLVEDYWHELVTGMTDLGHRVDLVVLHAEDDEVRRRIETDEVEPGARDWRLRHLDASRAARAWWEAEATAVVDTTRRTPQEAATAVRAALARRQPDDVREPRTLS